MRSLHITTTPEKPVVLLHLLTDLIYIYIYISLQINASQGEAQVDATS